MTIGRREFLGSAVAGTGAAVVVGSSSASAADKAPRKTFDPYEKVALGKTGIQVTRFGLGTGMRGWKRQSNQTRMGQAKFTALIKHAWDRGIRLFDMADLYGSHPFFAKAMKTLGLPRKECVLISKVWLHPKGLEEAHRDNAEQAVARFLKELQTDYIDVVLLHCQQKEDWPTTRQKDMQRLARLKKAGTIRAHGVSIHGLSALKTCATEPWVDSINTRINPYGAYMDGPPEKVAPVLKQIHDAGKGVVGMKLVGQGKFRTSDEQRDKSVRWVLGLGSVDTMVVGCENPGEIDDFAARVKKVPRDVKTA